MTLRRKILLLSEKDPPALDLPLRFRPIEYRKLVEWILAAGRNVLGVLTYAFGHFIKAVDRLVRTRAFIVLAGDLAARPRANICRAGFLDEFLKRLLINISGCLARHLAVLRNACSRES